MAFKVTFNSVDCTSFVKRGPGTSPRVTMKQNERSTAQMNLIPGLLPNKFDPVTIYDIDGTTPVFGGVVLNRVLQSYEQGSFNSEVLIECVDMMAYTDWAFWYKVYTASKTLKQVLTDLVADKLTAYGITLDAAQDDGDTFAPFTVGNNGLGQKTSDFLRDIAGRCVPPRVVQMSPAGALRVLVPGTSSAPFNITDAAPHCLNVDWTDSDFTPANKVTLVCGPTGQGTPTQSWTKTTGQTSWEVDIQCVPGAYRGGTVLEGATTRTVSPPGQYGYYYFDETSGKGTLSVGLGSAPADGTVLQYVYTAVYPFTVTATSGATPVIEQQYADEKMLLLGPAQLKANGLLSQLNQSPRELTILTLDRGFAPNQSMTVTLSNKNLAGVTVAIAQIEAEFTEFRDTVTSGAAGREMWLYALSASETTVFQGSYLQQMRNLLSGGSGAGGGGSAVPVSIASGGISAVPAVVSEDEGAVVKFAPSEIAGIPEAFDTIYQYGFEWYDGSGVKLSNFHGGMSSDMDGGLSVASVMTGAVYTPNNASGGATAELRAAAHTPFTVLARVLCQANSDASSDKGKILIEANDEIRLTRGLIFPATQVASSNVNELDDYEEGTFTVDFRANNVNTSVAYTSRSGRYTKNGDDVHVEVEFVLTNNGTGSGVLTVEGCPFDPGGNVVGSAIDVTAGCTLAFTPFVVMAAGVTSIYLAYHDTGTGLRAQMTDAHITDAFACRFSIDFKV